MRSRSFAVAVLTLSQLGSPKLARSASQGGPPSLCASGGGRAPDGNIAFAQAKTEAQGYYVFALPLGRDTR